MNKWFGYWWGDGYNQGCWKVSDKILLINVELLFLKCLLFFFINSYRNATHASRLRCDK